MPPNRSDSSGILEAAALAEADRRVHPAVPWWPGAAQALGVWLGSRALLAGFVSLAGYLIGAPEVSRIHDPGSWFLERLTWWDSFHFLRIADLGYLPPGLGCCDQAFFPGYPGAIRTLSPLTGGSTTWSALLVSLLAGAVAAVLLWRLAAERAVAAGRDPQRAGLSAVIFLAVAPYGIFLSAAYSEATFLAFALAAWWAATRRHWWAAGLLVAVATAVRINGVFLAAALAVLYLGQLRADGRWRPRPDVLALLAPVVSIGAFFAWLHHRTGSWTAWQDAETIGWHRQNAWPWQGLQAGWHALSTADAPDLVVSRTADLATVLAGLALLGVLLWLRRWAESTYLALNLAVLVCSTVLISSPRYALTWFPGFLLAAELAGHPRLRRMRPLVVACCAPLAAVVALSFSAHQWVA
ncbi:MAG TPA: mannosyltransferase family protein [Kineosporiaceae bacterium]|nr:mannosyltransferase family protein [Kineosporiaceae bacterium]